MSKRHTAILMMSMAGVFALLAAFTLAAITPLNAQSNTEILQQATTDPTVDAAVATMFAQTQQASSPDMTAVIATAFSAAQTATAEGQGSTGEDATAEVTAEPPVPTVEVSSLSAEVINTFELTGGPLNTSAYLAPDGEHFAYIDGEQVCLYTVDGEQQHCAPLVEEAGGIDRDSASWSRDSRYVAFAQMALEYFIDSDIWVYDTVENQLFNATEDDVDDLEFEDLTSGDGSLMLDLSPRWTDDGRLWFIRLSANNAGDVYTADPDGANQEAIYHFASIDAYQYYMMDVVHDGSAFALSGYSPSQSGIIRYENLAGGTSRSIRLPERFGISALTFSPDGQYLLLQDGIALSEFPTEDGAMSVVDVNTSRLRPVDAGRMTTAAGWLANQNSLVYSVFDVETDNIGLYLAQTPGEPGELVLNTRYFPTTSRSRHPYWMSSQNTFLASHEGDFYLNLIGLE